MSGPPYACKPPGCGDHGTCDTMYGACECAANWTGTHCHELVNATVPCSTDKDCGNWGHFGKCNKDGDGTCTCTNGFFGVRCEKECRNARDCGGEGYGVCLNGINQPNTCSCANNWSGVQCKTAPSAKECKSDEECKAHGSVVGQCLSNKCAYKCTEDSDCGWGGVQGGTCNKASGVCVCTKDTTSEKARAMFKGPFCEQLVEYEGKTCDPKSKVNQCERGLRCKPSKEDPGTGTCFVPEASPASKKAKRNAVFNSIASVDTLEMLLRYKSLETVAKGMSNKAIEVALSKALLDNGEKLVTNELVDKAAAKVPEILAVELVASQVASEATEKAASQVIKAIAREINPVGLAFELIDVFSMFGMALDMFDTRGLNEQMMQSVLFQFKQKFDKLINESPAARKQGLVFPRPIYPTETVAFKSKLHEYQSDMASDAADYVSKLLVNSNGQVIEPLYEDRAGQQLEDLKEKYPLYWSMSGHNERTFNNLVKYGWAIWVGVAVTVVTIVLTCVFTNDKVQASLKRKRT